jgi:uncharacterized protein (UPF0210 family)
MRDLWDWGKSHASSSQENAVFRGDTSLEVVESYIERITMSEIEYIEARYNLHTSIGVQVSSERISTRPPAVTGGYNKEVTDFTHLISSASADAKAKLHTAEIVKFPHKDENDPNFVLVYCAFGLMREN